MLVLNKIVIEGAKHTVSVEVNPELYWKTIDDFIEKHINNDENTNYIPTAKTKEVYKR